MTEAQEQALEQIKEIVTEHFEASILIVQYDPSDNSSDIETFWHGGYIAARGLLELGREDMKDNCDSDE